MGPSVCYRIIWSHDDVDNPFSEMPRRYHRGRPLLTPSALVRFALGVFDTATLPPPYGTYSTPMTIQASYGGGVVLGKRTEH